MNAELQRELHADIAAIQGQLHATRELLAGKIEQLSARIDVLEGMTAKMADSSQVETLSSEVKGAVASLVGIEGAVGSMKACVEQTVQQLLALSPEKVLGDLPERLRTLEVRPQPEVIDITPLEKDIAGMQQELASVREKADRALLAASAETVLVQEAVPPAELPLSGSAEEEEHRLLGYFDSPADKLKLTELVEAALDKGLNHKQVLDYVVRGLGPQQGNVISSHPSLLKDYIKSCRQHD